MSAALLSWGGGVDCFFLCVTIRESAAPAPALFSHTLCGQSQALGGHSVQHKAICTLLLRRWKPALANGNHHCGSHGSQKTWRQLLHHRHLPTFLRPLVSPVRLGEIPKLPRPRGIRGARHAEILRVMRSAKRTGVLQITR